MAVAIKEKGFSNIKIYNGGLKDWIKSGNKIEAIAPLPDTQVSFINVDELLTEITAADRRNCVDSDGQPLLTLIDFRTSQFLTAKKGADKYRIKTTCRTIAALLDDFIDNTPLVHSIPEKGLIVSISETGNRDVFLIRYLSKYNKKNIKGLKYGMRNWLKADYPVEQLTKTVKYQ